MAGEIKLKGFGVKDMLYFSGKPAEREKFIQNTPAKPLTEQYETNRKASERHPVKQRFVIKDIIDRGQDVKSFVFESLENRLPSFFRAGQYVVVRQIIDGKLIARPISISSGPEDALNGKMEITVKRNPNGYMSGWILDHWKKGDEVVTSGPQGTFYYEKYRDCRNVAAVCGGSGITPVLSMAKAIASGDEDFELTILYGSRTRKDILFEADFKKIMERTKKVKLISVLSDEKLSGYEQGFVGADLIRKYMGQKEFSLFASGPQGMYRFLDQEVEKLGLDEKHYRKEIFGASHEPWKEAGYPADARNRYFHVTVKMCDRTYDIEADSNETLLVAFERAGVAGPNRCRGGICGYCRSKLLSGEVFIPEDTDGRRQADKAYGYIHPCASFPVSDLVLEVPNNK